MTDLALSDIQALLDVIEPSGVSGFVPTTALHQLAETMRERDALLARLDAIRGVLAPIAEESWSGKWRVVKAIELTR